MLDENIAAIIPPQHAARRDRCGRTVIRSEMTATAFGTGQRRNDYQSGSEQSARHRTSSRLTV
jgi:hypothetical protein